MRGTQPRRAELHDDHPQRNASAANPLPAGCFPFGREARIVAKDGKKSVAWFKHAGAPKEAIGEEL